MDENFNLPDNVSADELPENQRADTHKGQEMSAEERFWSNVERRGDGCWIWCGHRTKSSVVYGSTRFHGKTEKAHRVAWILVQGKIPEGINVLHKCDNGICVNPTHLFLGTLADNNADCRRKGRTVWQRDRRKAEAILAKARRTLHAKGLGVKGEAVGNAVLTENTVRKSRNLHEHGWTIRGIAAMFGLNESTVRLAVRRKTWAHVK